MPWQWMIFFADAKKATERHDRIGYMATLLVQHHVVNGSQRLPSGIANPCPIDFAGGDHRGRFTFMSCSRRCCVAHSVSSVPFRCASACCGFVWLKWNQATQNKIAPRIKTSL